MLQIILTIILYLIMVVPVGTYVYHIAAGKHTFADPVFDRVDGVIFKISGVDPASGMNWKRYAAALVGTNAVMIYCSPHSEYSAVQPQWNRGNGGVAFVQYHHQLYDQYQPAALFR